MSAPSTTILACRVDQSIVLRLSGRVTAEFCPAFRDFCTGSEAPLPTAVALDVQEVEHFDSTFLGTLLCLRERFGPDGVILHAPGAACLDGLRRMGALQLFPIRAEPAPEGIAWTTLSDNVTPRDAFEFQHLVVEAHAELARLPGPLQKVYEPIARQAAKEFADRHGWESLSTVRIPKPRPRP